MRTGHFTSTATRDRFRALHRAVVAGLGPTSTRDIGTSHGTVHVLTCAGPPGDPIVLLPGAGSPGVSWASNVPPLRRLATVHLVDPLGGPGASTQDVPIRSVDDQLRWLRDVLDALGPCHLVGTSMGGRLAFEVARRAPAGIRTLTLLDPALTFTRIPPGTVAASLGALPGAPSWLRRRFVARLGGGADVAGDPVAELIEAGLSGYAPAVPLPPLPTARDVAAVGVGTLVLLGGRSTMLDAGRARERAALLPRGTVEVWPDATHALPGEFPDRVAERLSSLVAAS
ncbi:alpha/beta fold hydrolase [Pseudonocardia alni]|uniref:Pimeloyl-ACP methyl ester carboxylesterase n=1 Tax=Pseudonocardia alni TaxID=33907 RepID=A0AA44UQS2_PSEA5|nr:alpha/beta hydrolase [Pseudonocardia alni]PKB31812.1 pimeloyl-ACP methyl ester carboxylesterase [Pseudonocardia alni]